MNLEVINRRLKLLVDGLIYVIYKQDRFWDNVGEVEERCKEALEKVGRNPIPFTERAERLIYNEWITQEAQLQVSKKVEANHRQYYWIYAIMQRYVIDGMTPYQSRKLRERERDWNDILRSLSGWRVRNG